ncbi:MAG: hypothetical protein Q8R13_00915 [bacterium]|nr:hypothetical protein [bacterium]MDZ4295774.1 hypothetical protein [Patescibacteria group bacterium]
MAVAVRNIEIDIDGTGARQTDVRLTLELTANLSSTGGEIRAEAIFTTERPSRPIRHKRIEFECGTEIRYEETNDRGIASVTFGVGFGTHSVRATLEGTGLSAREQHTFSRPSPKVPKRLNVMVAGERGRQELRMRLTAEDGSAVGGHTITIRQGDSFDSVVTVGDGTASYHLHFDEPTCYIEVQGGNESELIWRRIVRGR